MSNELGAGATTVQCGFCESAAASKKCNTCQAPLCDSCATAIHSKGVYKSHSLVPIIVHNEGFCKQHSGDNSSVNATKAPFVWGDHGDKILLSSDSLTATANCGIMHQTVRSSTVLASGSSSWNVVIDNLCGDVWVGIIDESVEMHSLMGDQAGSYCVALSTDYISAYSNKTEVFSTEACRFHQGDVIGVRFDVDPSTAVGTLSFSRNGEALPEETTMKNIPVGNKKYFAAASVAYTAQVQLQF
eukprot:GEZU01029488.1.p2 GENE.GEZU01029488.1~~GEZU01029488.1.p2  ORF type:complete len:244 (+),score=34.37 GEZU01029488.1:124-855(+)